MKKVLNKVIVSITLVISSMNYASQPTSWGSIWAPISNWAKEKWQGLPQFMPNVNFYQQAKNLVNRLNLDQRYTLYRIVRAALGIEQEEPIQKPGASPLNIQPTSKSKTALEPSINVKETTKELNVLVIPTTTVSAREDTVEMIEKELGFEEVNINRIWDKNNYKNVIIFLRQEEDNWNGLGSHNNTNTVKCQLFRKNIYPIIQGVKTRSSFEVDIMFPILVNTTHKSFGLRNQTDLVYYSDIMEKYIDQCGLQKIWPEKKVKKELPQSSKIDYGYGPLYSVKKR